MLNKKNKRISLLRYWTTRYLATLFIGLLLIAFFSIAWINKTTLENRLTLAKFLTEEAADRIVDENGQIIQGNFLKRFVEERQAFLNLDRDLIVHVINRNGEVSFGRPSPRLFQIESLPLSVFESPESVIELTSDTDGAYYLIKTPITYADSTIGWVVVLQSKKELAQTDQEYPLLAIMLVSIALLGWIVIYFLSKKLATPIQQVADAAKKIQEGDYTTELPINRKEKEVYELIHSFKEMSERLHHLESLRAELLAGITHELKTPVTSISSITQAIRDEVVTGEEVNEFLDISLKETNRLQKMIEDLLDFNSFSAGAIRIQKEKYNINEFIHEIAHQWHTIRGEKSLHLDVELPEKTLYSLIDPIRVEQILLNLLNNSKEAMSGNGTINVKVYELDPYYLAIDVKDEGIGIPKSEQNLIFERFYRGENKKHTIRGLGLGLPFSRMLALALDGNLQLKESSPSGTTLTLKLPRNI